MVALVVVVVVVVVVVMVVSAPSQIDSDQAAPLARPCPPADGTVCVCVGPRRRLCDGRYCGVAITLLRGRIIAGPAPQ